MLIMQYCIAIVSWWGRSARQSSNRQQLQVPVSLALVSLCLEFPVPIETDMSNFSQTDSNHRIVKCPLSIMIIS